MNNFGVTAAPQFQMGQSNLPIRTAPIPPTPTIVNSNVVPQIMVTQDQDFSIFEGKHCRICIVQGRRNRPDRPDRGLAWISKFIK